jgi:hypothetical protein
MVAGAAAIRKRICSLSVKDAQNALRYGERMQAMAEAT